MCGIAGIVNGSVQPLVDKQHHRGPDNFGISGFPDCEFGHNRLSIIDLTDAGRQPMKQDFCMLTYNGEIYNYQELRSYLIKDDDLADTVHGNDARTLLSYAVKYGLSKTLHDINGMFAFAIYSPGDRVIHLAVDRFAQKPMYYYHSGDQFAFASSPAALLHLKDKWEINRQALQSFWKLGSIMQDSIFEGIKKVNAAEHVTYSIEHRTLTTYRYWEPEYQSNTDGIEDLILDSINKVKVSDVPVYLFLSGGIDSTLVASQFKGGNAIHLDSPELKYAEQVAKKFNINLHKVTPADCDPIQSMDDYVLKSAEPTMAGLTPYIVAKEAAKFCKVAVSANGADECFGGYDRISQDVTQAQMDHIFRGCVDYKVELPGMDPQLSSGRWLELQTYVQHDLNKTLDFASMASSLEVRNPFLDHRLVEMALSIPAEKMGRKKILKDMLIRMGFDGVFTERPKLGFSLYKPVPGLEQLQKEAYEWVINEGWLKLIGQPNKRDYLYLSASAFGFRRWWETYKYILG